MPNLNLDNRIKNTNFFTLLSIVFLQQFKPFSIMIIFSQNWMFWTFILPFLYLWLLVLFVSFLNQRADDIRTMQHFTRGAQSMDFSKSTFQTTSWKHYNYKKRLEIKAKRRFWRTFYCNIHLYVWDGFQEE